MEKKIFFHFYKINKQKMVAVFENFKASYKN